MTHDKLEKLKADVDDHGEVHVYIADIGEKDIRSGEASFDMTADILTVDDGQTVHRWADEHIIGWYKPRG